MCPGTIDTPMLKIGDKNAIDQIVSALALRRFGKPEGNLYQQYNHYYTIAIKNKSNTNYY